GCKRRKVLLQEVLGDTCGPAAAVAAGPECSRQRSIPVWRLYRRSAAGSTRSPSAPSRCQRSRS
ncbi:MAG: hypothetical protein ACH34U_13750, partial [Cyanobium sp.]